MNNLSRRVFSIPRRILLPAVVLAFIHGLSTRPIAAQTINPVGTPESLDLATWNIEWFGDANNGPSDEALQLDRVRTVIESAGIDLWGVQEIADQDAFDALIQALGSDYDGRLATNSGTQRIGSIFDTRTVRVRQVRHVLESFLFEFAGRPPLQLEADVVLPDTTVTMTFIVVHMKAFSDRDSYERRQQASIRLKNHIDFTSLASKPVIVLGDYNDELLQSTFAANPSPYENFVNDDAGYFYVSLPLEQSGAGSFCNNSACTATGSMLDHILISNELFDAYLPESAGFIQDLPAAITSYGSTTSDHLPVLARFEFTRTQTAVESENPRERVALVPPYPNPFSDFASVLITLDRPTRVAVDVFDALGRRVETLAAETLSPGVHELPLDGRRLPQGVYFIRLATDGQIQTRAITRR